MNLKQAEEIAGTLGFPSKMPGTSYGIPAEFCITGAKLARIPGSICHDCYALKGNYIFPSVKQSQLTRLEGISHPEWTAAMVYLLTCAHKRGRGRKGVFAKGWHRWHDSGDIQSEEHLTKIAAVAALTPRIRHWLPIKELGILKKYLAKGGVIPTNLTVRVSATMIDGDPTQQWPLTSRVHSDKAPKGVRTCPAPKQDGECGTCRACWNPKVKSVSYHHH